MTQKNIIFIIAIVVVLSLAGYILYQGFSSGDPDSTLIISTAEVAPVAPILSQGTSLDFSPVQKYNSQEQLFAYPKPSSDEISLPLPDLIK